jgi:tetratricopeptide (TPR) repeat protein
MDVTAGLLDQFRETSSPPIAANVAWYGALTRDGAGDPEGLVRLAEFAVKRLPSTEKASALNTLGAALYRAGRSEDAIRRLEEGGRLRKGADEPLDWPFLAMAHHRLGHREEARRWLDRLHNRQASTDPNKFWEEMEFRLLRSEAEALILYDPVFPADPFAH